MEQSPKDQNKSWTTRMRFHGGCEGRAWLGCLFWISPHPDLQRLRFRRWGHNASFLQSRTSLLKKKNSLD